MTTHTLDAPGATLTYDVHEPDSPNGRRPLFVFGSPMGASGFEQLVGHNEYSPDNDPAAFAAELREVLAEA